MSRPAACYEYPSEGEPRGAYGDPGYTVDVLNAVSSLKKFPVVASYPDMLTRWRRSAGATPTPAVTGGRRWRSDWTAAFGSPEENPDFWNGISANSYLEDISGPVQLHHGTADSSVPVEFSEILYQQLQEAGKTVEYYEYEGDDHNISNLFSLAMTRTIEFFDRY